MDNLTQEEAKNALTFLVRCDLKGNEVPAFNQVILKLSNIAKGEPEFKPLGPGEGD